eukprot:1194586-Prorocentrum_minimum.AAC.2
MLPLPSHVWSLLRIQRFVIKLEWHTSSIAFVVSGLVVPSVLNSVTLLGNSSAQSVQMWTSSYQLVYTRSERLQRPLHTAFRRNGANNSEQKLRELFVVVLIRLQVVGKPSVYFFSQASKLESFIITSPGLRTPLGPKGCPRTADSRCFLQLGATRYYAFWKHLEDRDAVTTVVEVCIQQASPFPVELLTWLDSTRPCTSPKLLRADTMPFAHNQALLRHLDEIPQIQGRVSTSSFACVP